MRRRTIDKHIRFDEKENKLLHELSIKSGLTESDVIRTLLKGNEIKELPDKKFYDAINEINKVGVNINQLAKVANTNGDIYYDKLIHNLNYLNKILQQIKNKYLWYNIIHRSELIYVKTIKQFKEQLIEKGEITFSLMNVTYYIKIYKEKVRVTSSYSKKIITYNSVDDFIKNFQIYGSTIKDNLEEIEIKI